jgi:hypothetical protein
LTILFSLKDEFHLVVMVLPFTLGRTAGVVRLQVNEFPKLTLVSILTIVGT